MLIGRLVAQRLVNSCWIVKRFDIREHAQPRILQRLVLVGLRPFVLERPGEPFGDRVVVAVAAATHRARVMPSVCSVR